MANGFEQVTKFALDLRVKSVEDAKKVAAITRAEGELLKTRIQRNASGRPGPNAITGDYRRSWSTRYSAGPGSVSVSVGTNAPQARRLEFGFVGVDSIGRHYNQPPFPHVQPAIDATVPEYLTALEKALGNL